MRTRISTVLSDCLACESARARSIAFNSSLLVPPGYSLPGMRPHMFQNVLKLVNDGKFTPSGPVQLRSVVAAIPGPGYGAWVRLPSDITPQLLRVWIAAPAFSLLLVGGVEFLSRNGHREIA